MRRRYFIGNQKKDTMIDISSIIAVRTVENDGVKSIMIDCINNKTYELAAYSIENADVDKINDFVNGQVTNIMSLLTMSEEDLLNRYMTKEGILRRCLYTRYLPSQDNNKLESTSL